MRDQRIGCFGEGGLNRLFILNESALLLRFSQLNGRFEPSGGENRLRDLGHETPRAIWSAKETRELRALSAEEPAETDLREVSSFRSEERRVGKGWRSRW